uniref:Uncharacterized protein n=1 Tax=Arundo donax TaxID=35708 RepID=A0A0A8YQ93_ARUDO
MSQDQKNVEGERWDWGNTCLISLRKATKLTECSCTTTKQRKQRKKNRRWSQSERRPERAEDEWGEERVPRMSQMTEDGEN